MIVSRTDASITATVDGGATATVKLQVTAAKYSLEASPDTLTLGVETEVTFTLTRNGEALANVEVTLSGKDVTINPADTTTGSNGTFSARLTATGTSTATRTITATVGTDTATVDLSVGKATFGLTDSGGDPQFTKNKQTKTLKAKLTDAAGTEIPLGGTTVKWTVVSSTVSCEAWNRKRENVYNGLTWGTTPLTLSAVEENDKYAPAGNIPTGAEASLTDIVGERTVTVTATVEYNGQWYTAEEKTVTFGNGPLSVFKKPLSSMSWTSAKAQCGALPSTAELRAVAGPSPYNTDPNARGAALAAKWPRGEIGVAWYTYWSGETYSITTYNYGVGIYLVSGNDISFRVGATLPVAVCRH